MFKANSQKHKKAPLHIAIKKAFLSEKGVIDLASIMVGTIVTGLIGGVVASTVFVVIPWTQDNAAEQQLTSITVAQDAYFGMSADPQTAALPAGTKTNSFANSAELKAANLLDSSETYCVSTSPDKKSYEAFAKSNSGSLFIATDKNTAPVAYSGSLPYDCLSLLPPYVDPSPTTTIMTYKCDVDTTGAIPMSGNLTGTETWSDGQTKTYAASVTPALRSFSAGVTYRMTFVGTYRSMTAKPVEASSLSACLLSVDHWGMNTGITNVTLAFLNAKKLVSVPEHIPLTIENMSHMFDGASSINDPNISKWNVSNVTSMDMMFAKATSFNQPLNHWNVSKVTNMGLMFFEAKAFNQTLNNWDVSNVTNMHGMFSGFTNFNQSIGGWNVSKVNFMQEMFYGSAFNQPIGSWNVSNVTNMQAMFARSSFNQPIGSWNVSNVTNMKDMFATTSKFNQPIDSWNVSNVTTLATMFSRAAAFNQPLSSWNTARVTDMTQTFAYSKVFNQNISMWSLASNPTGTYFREGSALTAVNSPFGV